MLNVVLIGKLTSHASAKKPGIGAPFTDLTVMTITPNGAGFNKPLVQTHAIRAYNLLGDDVAGLDKGDTIHLEGTIESWQRQEIREANGELPRHMVQVDGYRVIAEHIEVIQFADGTPSAFTQTTITAPALKVQPQAQSTAAPVFIPKVAAASAKPWTVTRDSKVVFSGTVTEARKAFDDKTSNLRRGSYQLLSPEGILIDKAEAICIA
jgi:hypothetical protein